MCIKGYEFKEGSVFERSGILKEGSVFERSEGKTKTSNGERGNSTT